MTAQPVMGIDCGTSSGAVAILTLDGAIYKTLPMPTMTALTTLIKDVKPLCVYIEKAQAMPGQGVCSMFNYGAHFGCLVGIMTALGQDYWLVPPQTWTRVIHRGAKMLTSKEKSRECAERLWPGYDLRANSRCRVPHLGIIDALLIAEYGRTHYHGRVRTA